MTSHLLAITVGPVQEFIAAARRTRDLWFGSHLLSEISKAAAKAVQANGGKLIFPAPANDEDLDRDSPLNVVNVILAELPEADPAAVAGQVKQAVRSRWREFANHVFGAPKNTGIIRTDIWNDQVDDVIECYAAWHPYTPSTYHADRAALMRLLASRKRCRDFPHAKGRAGVAKSSLDGLRESVLRDRKELPDARRGLRLNEGEELDVVGLVKRTWQRANEIPHYPSVSRVAADPWLRKVAESPHFDELVQACRALNRSYGGDVMHELDVSPRGHPHYAGFPFEGTAVFRSRYREFCQEAVVPDSALEPLRQALGKLTREPDVGDPDPYLGILVADGDHMGKALSNLKSPDDHRSFSRALAQFAAEARQIVNAHNGVLVYAGGDDVLAFVPIDHSLACARKLHDTFSEILADWAAKIGIALSLSVGLAIAHFMEPLEDLRSYAREAEQHAKHPGPEDGGESRNGLAVHLVKRGGGKLAVRANWSEDLDKRLADMAGWIKDRAISGRVAYDLHKIADQYDSWPVGTAKDAIRRDTLSVMAGKEPRGESQMGKISDLVQGRVTGAESLRGLANELLIAKAIAANENAP
ncbi:MAG: type III-B CRISPR-associated protein Cas10/Cmr2 [Candidatus Binataceae bacterium]